MGLAPCGAGAGLDRLGRAVYPLRCDRRRARRARGRKRLRPLDGKHTYRQPRFRRILPLYITLVIVLVLQGLEQWALGYSEILAAMFPANFAPPVLWSPRLHHGVFTRGWPTDGAGEAGKERDSSDSAP